MLEPVFDIIVLELIDSSINKTSLLLPEGLDNEKDPAALFKVLAAGPGTWDEGVFISNPIAVGDIVFVSAYGTTKFKYEGKKVFLSRAQDVMLKIKE
jgi:co-chaperonin GroES (HSP10)